MSDGTHIFDGQVQEANAWLREIGAEVGGDQQAYQALRATLHALRDRVTIGEATHLGAQLPLVIKGLYYDQWRPHDSPKTYRTRDEFLEEVRKGMTARDDLSPPVDPDEAARAVFHALRHHVSDGQISEVIAMLPEPVRALWH